MTAPRYRTGAANRHRRRFSIMDIFSDTAAIFVGEIVIPRGILPAN
jgi:hypothetical protein